MTTDAPQISEREKEILRLVAKGATNQQIAQELHISVNTVKVHLRNIFGKIGAASRTEATVYAIRHGLVAMGERTLVVAEAPVEDVVEEPLAPEPILAPAVYKAPEDADVPAAQTPPPTPIHATPIEPIAPSVIEPAALASPTVQDRSTPRSRYLLLGIIIAVGISAAVALGYMLRQPVAGPTAAAGTTTPPQPRWAKRTALPQARDGFATAIYDGSIYVIGGSVDNKASPAMSRYNIADNSWTPLSAKPTPANQIQAVTIGGKVYVPGGEDLNGNVLDVLEAYDTRTQQWEQLPKMPAIRSRYALATVEGKLYLFGGWDGQQNRSEVFSYDPGSKTWATLAPLPTPRQHSGAAVVNGDIFVIGGENETGALRVNERFSPFDGSNGTWDIAGSLPAPIAQPAVVGLLNTVSVFDPQLASLHQYAPDSETWITKGVEQDVAVSSRAVALNTSIFVFGKPDTEVSSVALNEYQDIYTTFFPNAFSNP